MGEVIFTRHWSWAAVAIALAALPALAQEVSSPPPPPELPVVVPQVPEGRPLFAPDEETGIPNYFLHILKLIEERKDKPIPEPRSNTRGLAEPRDYPFDGFEEFDSHDMLRAIKEGIRYAEDTGYGKSPEQVARQVEANIRLMLQYYPVAAADRDGFKNLVLAMESPQANPIFRKVLMQSANPARYNESLFTQYFQDQIRDVSSEVLDLYAKVVQNSLDQRELRLLAMENMFALRDSEMCAVLAKDPGAAAFQAANGRPPSPKDLKAPPSMVLGRASVPAFKAVQRDMDATAGLLGGLLRPEANTLPSVQRAARAMLARMKDEWPLSAPELLDQYLAASPEPAADAVDPEPVVPTPVVPGEGEGDAPVVPAPANTPEPQNDEALSF